MKTKTKEKDRLPITLTDYKEETKKAWELIGNVAKKYKFFRDLAKQKAILYYKTIAEEELEVKLDDKDIVLKEEIIVEFLDIPPTKRKYLVVLADQILGAVADLSLMVEEEAKGLEAEYVKKYLHSPALGKVLFFDHQEKIFETYDKLKNKCFDLLMKLDPDAKIVEEIE
jgi:hypothetical protein